MTSKLIQFMIKVRMIPISIRDGHYTFRLVKSANWWACLFFWTVVPLALHLPTYSLYYMTFLAPYFSGGSTTGGGNDTSTSEGSSVQNASKNETKQAQSSGELTYVYAFKLDLALMVITMAVLPTLLAQLLEGLPAKSLERYFVRPLRGGLTGLATFFGVLSTLLYVISFLVDVSNYTEILKAGNNEFVYYFHVATSFIFYMTFYLIQLLGTVAVGSRLASFVARCEELQQDDEGVVDVPKIKLLIQELNSLSDRLGGFYFLFYFVFSIKLMVSTFQCYAALSYLPALIPFLLTICLNNALILVVVSFDADHCVGALKDFQEPIRTAMENEKYEYIKLFNVLNAIQQIEGFHALEFFGIGRGTLTAVLGNIITYMLILMDFYGA